MVEIVVEVGVGVEVALRLRRRIGDGREMRAVAAAHNPGYNPGCSPDYGQCEICHTLGLPQA